MKYKVMYTAGAKKDLRNIFRYISEELLAPENAAGQTDRIMAAIRNHDGEAAEQAMRKHIRNAFVFKKAHADLRAKKFGL